MQTRLQRPFPSFIGLAWTILIPVVLLTGFAMLRVWQDRARVLDQARREAASLAPRVLALAGPELESFFAATTRSSPDPPDANALLGEAELHLPDRWIHPATSISTPLPPAWLNALAPEVRVRLEEAERLESDPTQLAAAVDAWNRFATSAPKEAQPCALLRKLRLMPQDQRRAGLLVSLKSIPSGATTLTGLPLLPMATLEYLNTDPTHDPISESLTQSVARSIRECPSYLTPLLFARIKSLWDPPTPDQQSLLAHWDQAWQRDETTRRLLPVWSRESTLPGQPLSRWITDPDSGKSLFALLSPSPETNGPARLFLLDATSIDDRLQGAADRLKSLLPPYSRAELQLLGRPSTHPAVSPGIALHQPPTPPLAVVEEALKLPSLGTSLPLRLELQLSDPTFLYSQENRRASTLGIAVISAGLIALLGVLALWKAFQRQTALYEAQTNFISSVSHELRTPIASMSLMAENLARDNSLNASRKRDYYSLLVQECRRLSSLLENVLSLSRIEQQRNRPALEPMNFKALVLSVCRSMQPLAEARGVQLQSQCPPEDEIEAQGDPAALERALINLIDNAIKHSPTGSAVTVTVQPDPQSIALSVEDQGPGIPLDEQKKVFERFYRRGSELRRETRGIGIGLTLVKQIAEDHHGEITLESQLGQGCRFTLRIPVQQRSLS